jgi:multidrug efflux pump
MKDSHIKSSSEQLSAGWASFFITRPVLAWVLNIILILLGFVAYFQLPVRQYPQVEFPKITVVAQYSGASPSVMEMQVTRPLEEALAGLQGLDLITSESSAGQSKVKLQFKPSRSIDAAASDVRDRLSNIETLPQEVATPRVQKADLDSESVVSLALYGKKHELSKLYDYANRYLKNELESIQGVATVNVYGGATYEMHVILDPVKLAAFGLTASEVSDAIRAQNLNKPAGKLGDKDKEFLVVTKAQLETPEEFEGVVLFEKNGHVVRLRDVGHVKVNKEDRSFRVRYNGRDAIMLGVIAQSRASPVQVSAEVKKRLGVMRDALSRGMFLKVATDSSVHITRSISQVYQSIWEAIFLVLCVVLFFLHSWRLAFVPLITIPISLISTFFIMYVFGFSINVLTLLALVLAVGLVVDDAIVVLENIYRHVERGLSPLKAAFKGIREIQFSVIGMTLTLVAVYAPIALSSGMAGRVFTEFAITLAGAVLISGFVALVLSPMLCARLIPPKAKKADKVTAPKGLAAIGVWVEGILTWADNAYQRSLQWVLGRRLWVIGIAVLLSLGGVLIQYTSLPSELVPREDQGVLSVTVDPPVGSTLAYLDRYGKKIDKILSETPEVERRLLFVSPSDYTYDRATLVPVNQRPSCKALLPALEERLAKEVSGVRTYAFCPSRSIVGGKSDYPFSIVLQTSSDYKRLQDVTRQVRRFIAQQPEVNVTTIQWDLPASAKEYEVVIRRDVAAASGVSVENIARILDMLVGTRKIGTFERESRVYPIRMTMSDENRLGPEDLKGIVVKGRKDGKEKLVALEGLVDIKERISTQAINRYGGMRGAMIMARLNQGQGVQEFYQALVPKIKRMMPTNFRLQPAGELKRLLTEQNTVLLIFGLAILFIFLILAAQFESFRDPFIIMLSVPLALMGGVLFLWIAPGGSMNIYSQIGFVTLIGLITKHGILLVDFANQERTKNKEPMEALIEACRLRLRPILMTTFAMVLGALPLMLGTSSGFESRRQVGLVIVGGMSLGTFFTLFVIPVVYSLISKGFLSRESQGERASVAYEKSTS